jgi:hypothetical protein
MEKDRLFARNNGYKDRFEPITSHFSGFAGGH